MDRILCVTGTILTLIQPTSQIVELGLSQVLVAGGLLSSSPSPGEITRLLDNIKNGDQGAVDRLIPLVYSDLKKMARRCFRGERKDHTLEPTALVHEVYLRLVHDRKKTWKNRSHFFATASILMRNLLIDYARKYTSDKRGGDAIKLSLDVIEVIEKRDYWGLLLLDQALSKLQQEDPRQAEVVLLRFFGRLNEDEIAEVMGVSSRTVKRDWQMARIWLHREIAA